MNSVNLPTKQLEYVKDVLSERYNDLATRPVHVDTHRDECATLYDIILNIQCVVETENYNEIWGDSINPFKPTLEEYLKEKAFVTDKEVAQQQLKLP